MLKRKYRLKVGRLSNPKTYKLNFFNAKVSINSVGFPRFSFVVSKKVDKRATVRNKLKRKVGIGVRGFIGKETLGKDILFYPKKEVLDAPLEKVTDETKDFLKNLEK